MAREKCTTNAGEVVLVPLTMPEVSAMLKHLQGAGGEGPRASVSQPLSADATSPAQDDHQHVV